MNTFRKIKSFWWLLPAVAAILGPLGASPASAAVFTWNAAATGPAWSAASNWGGTAPAASDIANFKGASYSIEPSLTSTASVGGIWSTGGGSLVIGGATLTLFGATINGNNSTGIEVDTNGGPLTINAPLVLVTGQQWVNNSANALMVNGNISAPAI